MWFNIHWLFQRVIQGLTLDHLIEVSELISYKLSMPYMFLLQQQHIPHAWYVQCLISLHKDKKYPFVCNFRPIDVGLFHLRSQSPSIAQSHNLLYKTAVHLRLRRRRYFLTHSITEFFFVARRVEICISPSTHNLTWSSGNGFSRCPPDSGWLIIPSKIGFLH